MLKKLVAGSVLLVMLGTSSTMAYANPVNNRIDTRKERPKRVEVVKPVFEVAFPEENLTTGDKNLVLSFKAPQGTKVSIEVYHNVSKNPKVEDYQLTYDPIEITIGTFQRGWAEVELTKGLNQIKFEAKHKNGLKDNVIRVVNVMDIQEIKLLLEEIVTKSTLGIGKKP